MLLKDMKLQEWNQGDLRGFAEKEVDPGSYQKDPLELTSLSSSGHEVHDPVPVRLSSPEEQSNIIESGMFVGPRSGVLKARFVGKGFTQDKDSKSPSMLTHHKQRLSSSSHDEPDPQVGSCNFRCRSAFQHTAGGRVKRTHIRSGPSGDSVS